ncbi:histone deacetylase family protein [Polyangium jinanense]|uniref:Histone deacetylase n=1 Tax=Polyangium jinanense TaxID=2829994 RepID=A0A9X4AUY4_9BACT|nr:histone deacetylase [Polyangium jinanense]MDC3961638.1 histone deacetylase [Polyangium jinanense]MDC3983737.1 histone deacetylase [Polyangium jinanense]
MIATNPASQILVVGDALFDDHRSRGYHPERPERLHAARAALDRCAREGLGITPVETRDATEEELARVHDEAYLASLAKLAGHHASLDPDTYLAPSSVAAARRAAGAGITLVDALLDPSSQKPGEARSPGLALLRPPGHHATRSRGMGFCLLNNVAVAAASALAKGLERVAILDWDVHHGNGTQDIFWTDPRVLYISLHQFPYYPGTGAVHEKGGGDAEGYTVNVPLSQGAGDRVYAEAFRQIVDPVLEAFEPELILVSAGFDAHQRDPLADMCVSDQGYATMATLIARAAQRNAEGRLAFFLEGGYDLSALSSSLAETLISAASAVSAEPRSSNAPPASFRHTGEVTQARTTAAERWRGI